MFLNVCVYKWNSNTKKWFRLDISIFKKASSLEEEAEGLCITSISILGLHFSKQRVKRRKDIWTLQTLCHSALTLCLVGVILGRMENIRRKSGWKTVFFTVRQNMENTKDEKPRRKFSLLGKIVGRKLRKVDLWHFYTNSLWNQVKK